MSFQVDNFTKGINGYQTNVSQTFVSPTASKYIEKIIVLTVKTTILAETRVHVNKHTIGKKTEIVRIN